MFELIFDYNNINPNNLLIKDNNISHHNEKIVLCNTISKYSFYRFYFKEKIINLIFNWNNIEIYNNYTLLIKTDDNVVALNFITNYLCKHLKKYKNK